MAVIWGLDLKEIQWGKFRNSYMWNKEYHLRRTKFIVYQLAMILCVVSESLGTDVLSSYIDEQRNIERTSPGASVRNNDIVGAFSYNIFVGVYVATIFGAAFFFDLFWPERQESRAVRIAWKACSALTIVFTLSSAILLTVLLATHRAYLTGSTDSALDPPLEYKKNGEAIASLVLIWLGWLATIWATYIMFRSINHIERHGALSTSGKAARRNTDGGESGMTEVKETAHTPLHNGNDSYHYHPDTSPYPTQDPYDIPSSTAPPPAFTSTTTAPTTTNIPVAPFSSTPTHHSQS